MMKNKIKEYLKTLRTIDFILSGDLIRSAEEKGKTMRKVSHWNDSLHSFEVKEVTKQSNEKWVETMTVLRDGETSNLSEVHESRSRIIQELQEFKLASEEAIHHINCIEVRSEKFRTCYFWSGDNGNKSLRRGYGKRWSVPEYCWSDGEHEWTASYEVSQSRKYTYAHGFYYKDGKKTNLTALLHQREVLRSLLSSIREMLPDMFKDKSEETTVADETLATGSEYPFLQCYEV